MILTCPNCNSQFNVDIASFGNEGRKVRCSACSEVWFQRPHLDDVLGVIADRVRQNIDVFENASEYDSAENTEEKSSLYGRGVASIRGWYVPNSEGKEGRMLANSLSAGVFLFILLCLLIVSGFMMRAYPSAQAFYKMFGIHMKLPESSDVAFEDVKAIYEKDNMSVIGRIVNLSSVSWNIPVLEITVITPAENEGDKETVIGQWLELPPVDKIDSEQESAFEYKYNVDLGGNDTKEHSVEEEEEAHPVTEGEPQDNEHDELFSEGELEGDVVDAVEKQYFARIRFVVADPNSISAQQDKAEAKAVHDEQEVKHGESSAAEDSKAHDPDVTAHKDAPVEKEHKTSSSVEAVHH